MSADNYTDEKLNKSKLSSGGFLKETYKTLLLLKATRPGLFFTALIFLCLVLSATIELFCCNSEALFFNEDKYTPLELNLPNYANTNLKGQLLSPEHPALGLSIAPRPAGSVYIETYAASPRLTNFTLGISDSSNLKRQVPVATRTLNPGGTMRSTYFTFDAKGELSALTLNAEPQGLQGGVLITRIIINAPPPVIFSVPRWALIFICLAILITCINCRAWEITADFARSRMQRLMNFAVPAVAMLLCLLFFELVNPLHTNTAVLNIIGETAITLTDADHTLLRPFPTSRDELKNTEAYTQLLDGFLKGHLYLDFPVDPALAALDNPYDPTQRAAANVKQYWDCAFFNNHYYIYFGLAPLLLTYLPIWMLTGKLPALALSALILGLLSILTVFTAIQALRKILLPRPPLLIYLLAESALLCSLGIYTLQLCVEHYVLPYLSLMCSLGLFLTLLWSLPRQMSLNKQRACLFCAGIALVLVVMSRPLCLPLALLLGAPPLLYYLRLPRQTLTKGRSDGGWAADTGGSGPMLLPLGSALPHLLTPVIVGAVFTMWYNYARFGSILEFGQFYQLTLSDIRANSAAPDLTLFKSALWYFFLEPLNYVKNFPFVESASRLYTDHGGYLYLTSRLALLSLPLMWGSFLILLKPAPVLRVSETQAAAGGIFTPLSTVPGLWSAPDSAAPLRHVRLCFALTLLLLIPLAYLTLCNAGVCIRYAFDFTLPCGLVALFLICRYITWRPDPLSKLIYGLTLLLLAVTVVTGIFLPFTGDMNHVLYVLNPDGYLKIAELFSPLNY
ncbi:MAG: hypothetical protein IJ228_06655 [Succinivibrio sp.]|nr:hypothetical protein [Succinivibrio sp.]